MEKALDEIHANKNMTKLCFEQPLPRNSSIKFPAPRTEFCIYVDFCVFVSPCFARKCDGPLPFDWGASKNCFSLSAWGGPGERFGPFYVNSGQKKGARRDPLFREKGGFGGVLF